MTCAAKCCRAKPALKLKLPRSEREQRALVSNDPKDFLVRIRGAGANR